MLGSRHCYSTNLYYICVGLLKVDNYFVSPVGLEIAIVRDGFQRTAQVTKRTMLPCFGDHYFKDSSF